MKTGKLFFLAITLLLLCNMPAGAEKSNAVLESITFLKDSEKGESVSFKLNGAFVPKIFAIQDGNPRVVLDLPDTHASRQITSAIDTRGDLVKKIRVGIHNDQAQKIRVVFDLLPGVKYQYKHTFDEQANILIVTFSPIVDGVVNQQKEKKEKEIPKEKAPSGKGSAPMAANDSTLPVKGGGVMPEVKETAQKVEETTGSVAGTVIGNKEGQTPESPKVYSDEKAKSPVAITEKQEMPQSLPEKEETVLPALKQDRNITGLPDKKEPPLPAGKNGAASNPSSVKAEASEPQKEIQETQKTNMISGGKEEEPPEKKDTLDKKVPEKKPEPLLSSVSFESIPNKGEMILFKLNEFYPPTVIGIEKGDPQVVCEFSNIHLATQVKDVHCNGKYVKMVKVIKQTKLNKAKVILQLVPNKNYDLQQVFFKEDNLFVIIINSLENMPSEKAAGSI
jgi:hypothetical protein